MSATFLRAKAVQVYSFQPNMDGAARRLRTVLLAAALGVLFAALPAAAQVMVTISPPGVNLPRSGSFQFTATVTGSANTSVSWTILEGAAGGAISATGLYTAPATAGAFHVIATSQADTTKSATAMGVVPGIITADMNIPRTTFTAIALQNGQILLAGGGTRSRGQLGVGTATAEIYDPASGSFAPTGSMTTTGQLAAALLNNGKVLMAGSSATELYDPVTGMFTSTGSLSVARDELTATTLQNGMVLVTGGVACTSTCTTYDTAELYDPSTGAFTLTGNMTVARTQHTATLLQNGKVLIAGGFNTNNESGLVSTEIYDPATGTFTAGPSMNSPRAALIATALANGKVLLAGGYSGDVVLTSTDLYDPSTNTVTTAGSFATLQAAGAASLLANGQVLFVGYGGSDYFDPLAELYDPTTSTFTPTGNPNVLRTSAANSSGQCAAITLANGDVLLAGGSDLIGPLASAELYHPASGTFTTKTLFLKTPRAFHTLTALPDGTLLAAGGIDCRSNSCPAIASAEIYNPAANQFAFTGPMNNARSDHTATILNNGAVLVVGGWAGY